MRYHNITHDDMLNGDGLRVVLWVAGCNHRCPQCHNPITWDIEGGILFDDIAKAEVFATLDKDYISGITFSGGDPLHPENRTDIEKLIIEIHNKYPQKTIWLYTGYVWDAVKDLPYMQYVDVLVDGPFLIEQKDIKLHWRGSANQRVINVKETLRLGQIVLWSE